MEWCGIPLSPSSIASFSLWIVNAVYACGIIPQIVLNYRLKTVSGVSDLMLWGYIAAYITQIMYIFALNLVLPYKVLVPFGAFLIVLVIAQRFYYDRSYSRYLIFSYGALALASIAALPLCYFFPHLVGHIMGWIAVVLWSVYQIPQGVKMFFEKSTHGFSFWFATMMAIGVSVELVSAFVIGLPWQTIFIAGRGLIGYAIFCLEFIAFKR